MGAAAAVLLGVVMAGLGTGTAAGPAGSAPDASAVMAPACSTAVAPAPDLSQVTTAMTTGPTSPFGVAITSDSKTAFVADTAGAIFVYSLGTGSLVSENVDPFPSATGPSNQQQPASTVVPVGLALTPNGRYLVAASGTGAVVFHVAQLEKKRSLLSSWTVGSFASTGQGAIETAVSPDGNYVFVTEEDSHEMAVFDLQSALRRDFHAADLVGLVPLGLAPVGMAIAPDGRYLYVTSEEATTGRQEGTLTTVNLKAAERTPARAIVSTVPAGCSPVRVVASGSSVFVTARGSDALLEFGAKDLAAHPSSSLHGVVQVGEAPVGLALVDRARTIVVADSDRFGLAGRGANLAVVTVAAAGHMVLDGYLPSGSFPRDMAASRNGRWLLVSNYGSGQVESVDVAALP